MFDLDDLGAEACKYIRAEITPDMLGTAVLGSSFVPEITKYLRTVWLFHISIRSSGHCFGELTPANTLVISSTLIPANGKVAASASPTGVARHLLCIEREQYGV